jgi:hypothetical protein
MAIERKTVIDQIEITRGGPIQIRFAKLLVEDGKELACEWHRTTLEPGNEPDAMFAAVNDHLEQMGVARIEQDALAGVLRGVTPMVHTPDVVSDFQRKKAEAAARFEEQQSGIKTGAPHNNSAQTPPGRGT